MVKKMCHSNVNFYETKNVKNYVLWCAIEISDQRWENILMQPQNLKLNWMATVYIAVWLRKIRFRILRLAGGLASRHSRLFNRMNFLWPFLIWPLPYAISFWLVMWFGITHSPNRTVCCRWYQRNYGFIDTISLITAIVQQTVLFNIRMNSINQSSWCQRCEKFLCNFYVSLTWLWMRARAWHTIVVVRYWKSFRIFFSPTMSSSGLGNKYLLFSIWHNVFKMFILPEKQK